MPIERLPGSGTEYLLAAFDEEGNERKDDPHGCMSDRVAEHLRKRSPTDVFLFAHGWMGDVPAARAQYARWIANLAALEPRSGCRPLYIGLHWPSLPLGESSLGVSFSPTAAWGREAMDMAEPVLEDLVAEAVGATVDSPAAREALRELFERALADAAPERLPADVQAAYRVLDGEIVAAQRLDEGWQAEFERAPFDPEVAFEAAAQGSASFGRWGSRLLAPLRSLSFWAMKGRARKLGKGGVGRAISAWQGEGGPSVRFHLMGHSFGCLLMGATVECGVATSSLVLIQGALSLWSFSDRVPRARGMKPASGGLHGVPAKVRGPICVTRSEHDRAVGWLYPLAAGVAGQVELRVPELPRYGAMGAFGARGTGFPFAEVKMKSQGGQYDWGARGTVWNVESSDVIRAHSDIARPEVAWMQWSAARFLGGVQKLT